MRVGDIITNNTKGSYSILFSSPPWEVDYQEPWKHTGNLIGIGVVLDLQGASVKVICDGVVGWCYSGNVRVVE